VGEEVTGSLAKGRGKEAEQGRLCGGRGARMLQGKLYIRKCLLKNKNKNKIILFPF
jgi:hypothetical protein